MRTTIDFGIDLGTSNSAIAVQEGARPRLLPVGAGNVLLPSAVHIQADGKMVLGAAAMAMRFSDPANTAIEFKRLMGTGDAAHFPAVGKSFSPVELSVVILKELSQRAETLEGVPLRAAVITVPAMFQLPQCEATRQAAALAGIVHAPLLQEPIAAAMAHAGAGFAQEGHWLVYDLGGGTFDVSLVRSRAGRLQVLDHDGDNHLGGKDFNRVLARWAAEQVRQQGRLGEFRRTDPALAGAFARLAAESERVRIRLSERDQETLNVPDLAKTEAGESVGVDLPVDRGLLDSLIAPIIQRTTELCRTLLARNQMTAAQLKGIVLVGGPTRTPCLLTILQRELGMPVHHAMDPTTIVAAGAALFAATQKLPANLRSGQQARSDAVTLELEYESMTTNPRPLLVGKVIGNVTTSTDTKGLTVIVHGDGKSTRPVDLQGRNAFSVPLELRKGELNVFQIEMRRGSEQVPVEPSRFSILHGMSIAKPPLSQSVGVMLADNSVSWYLRKGAVLPARNTVTHATTVAMARGQSADAIKVPLVQGESERADRNKVVGVLCIHAEKITRDLPAGTEIQVTLQVDEFSRTSARGFVPLLNQWFDEIVLFSMEGKDANQVAQGLGQQKDRLKQLEEQANQLEASGSGSIDNRISEVEQLISEGDRDSVDLADQMVRLMSRQIDTVEAEARVDKVKNDFAKTVQDARALLSVPEQIQHLDSLIREFDTAMDRGDVNIAQSKKAAASDLVFKVLVQTPEYWHGLLRYLFQRFTELNLMGIAQQRFVDGATEMEKGADGMHEVARICIELIDLLPKEEKGQFTGAVQAVVSHVM